MDGFKKVKCKKKYGVWYYKVIKPDVYNDLDGPLYELYNEKYEHQYDFGCYGDMKYYIETGIVI